MFQWLYIENEWWCLIYKRVKIKMIIKPEANQTQENIHLTGLLKSTFTRSFVFSISTLNCTFCQLAHFLSKKKKKNPKKQNMRTFSSLLLIFIHISQLCERVLVFWKEAKVKRAAGAGIRIWWNYCPSQTKRSSWTPKRKHSTCGFKSDAGRTRTKSCQSCRLSLVLNRASSYHCYYFSFATSRRGKDAESLKPCCHVRKVRYAKELFRVKPSVSKPTQLVLFNDRTYVCTNWLHVWTFSQFLGRKEAGKGKFPVRFYCNSTSFSWDN